MKAIVLALFLMMVGQSASFAYGSGPSIYGGEKPYPWGTEAPFPWKSIEGTWVSEDLGKVLFVFKIIRQEKDTRYLQVVVEDSDSKQVIAKGVGVARREDRIVRAQVKERSGEEYYILLSNYQVKGPDGRITDETYLTLRPLSNDPKADRSYPIRKQTAQ